MKSLPESVKLDEGQVKEEIGS
ncbi:Protein of unknown function [Thermobacillus xylanilyticus]|uniref:Uncharacterized protein n=1 Tax=Thermobacillus xylanilyticus TaxID=76633 RepID=A0ABN7RTW7_THEXY|nr:Protein of unknown function [Thermobacillus xylanilyticus]